MSKKLINDEFITKSKAIHNDKYDYSNINYISGVEKIKIICSKHGEFFQTPNAHLRGQGCSKCRSEKISSWISLTTNKFCEKALKVHGNLFDYSKVNYISTKERIIIICKKHGEFLQCPNDHLNGCGCPKCKMSKGEIKIQTWLENNKIIYIHQKTFNECINPKTNRRLKYDFYIPNKNILIEFDGSQHFIKGKIHKYIMTQKDFEYIKYSDELKTRYATENRIKLVRIPYSQIKEIDSILITQLF